MLMRAGVWAVATGAIVLATGPMFLAAAPAGGPAGGPGAVDYAITLERHFEAAQKFALHFAGTTKAVQTSRTPDGGSTKTETDKTTTLEGEILVGKVNDKGQEEILNITVRKFTQATGTGGPMATTELLPANTVVKVEYQGEVVVFSNAAQAGDLPAPALAALQSLFPARKANRVTDDQRYGTPQRKKIGATWPGDVKALLRDRSADQQLDPANVTANVTLKSVKPAPTLGNIPCAEIEATVNMKNIPWQGMDPKESTMSIVFTKLVPPDAARPDSSTTVKTVMHLALDTPGMTEGAVTHTTVDSTITRVTEWRQMN